MTSREQLWYLINGLLDGKYRIDIFCDEFSRIYDFETDDTELSPSEDLLFSELAVMTCRFSNYEEDLKIPHMCFTEEEVYQKVREIKKELG